MAILKAFNVIFNFPFVKYFSGQMRTIFAEVEQWKLLLYREVLIETLFRLASLIYLWETFFYYLYIVIYT